MEIFPSTCQPSADDTFGPQVRGCRDDFDFTLLFEETVLTIVPLSFLLLCISVRLLYLTKRKKYVRGGWLIAFKQSLWLVFSALQLALLVLWITTSSTKTRASVASAALTFVASTAACLISYFDHFYSVRPSGILVAYLLLSLLFDVAHSRTLWLIHDHLRIAGVFTASVVVKMLLLISETKEKASILRSHDTVYPPESLSGLINASTFWWLNSLLNSGAYKQLSLNDLFTVDEQMSSANLESRLESAWGSASQKAPNSLLIAVAGVLKWTFLSAFFPRLLLIGLKFSQPFMVGSIIEFVGGPSKQSNNTGYGLIGSYAIVYIGIAICTARFQHLTYRLITMARGSLISIIYRKTLQLELTALGDSKPVTLMSTDVQRIASGLEFLHDAWASLIEIPLSLWLLQRQLGLGFLSPILVAVFSTLVVVKLGGLVGDRQKIWLEAIQRRIGVTVPVLQAMKGVKITGMTEWITTAVQDLRIAELESSKKFRELLVCAVTLSYTTSTISPTIAFGIYMAIAIRRNDGSTLGVDRAFQSLAIFALLFQPMLQLLRSIPSLLSAVGAFARIQEFMVSEAWEDQRTTVSSKSSIDEKHLLKAMSSEIGVAIAEKTMHGSPETIVIKNGAFGWNEDAGLVLQDINLVCSSSSFTMIVGPVGCGKSTFLYALLGETPLSQGHVQTSTSSSAYCGQMPWMTNSTVRENIIRFSPFDEIWYHRVLAACALEKDVQLLPNGDSTIIGNEGSLLSGGQKQRVALARAVYSRKQIVILDDIFSGLDPRTEEHVFNNVLGPSGLLRQASATVIMATNSANRLNQSDYVVAIGTDGHISQQGTFEELREIPGYVQGLSLTRPFHAASANKTTTPFTLPADGPIPADVLDIDVAASDMARQTGDLSLYVYYFKTIGWKHSLYYLSAVVGFAFSYTFPSIWVQWWTESNENTPYGKFSYFLGIYSGLSVFTLLCLALGCWDLMAYMVPRSSNRLHLILLNAVMQAPMSFSAKVDTGVTSNRFSQDMELIDMELPLALLNASSAFFLCIAQVALIAGSAKYIACGIPFVGLVFYFIQRYYLKTSRQIRFLDLEAKSPLYSNFLETLNGLASVRCFGLDAEYKKRNQEYLDASQAPFYMLYCVQRWLSVVLDLVVAAVAVGLVMMAVFLRTHMSPALLGVGLVNIISLGENLKGLITDWTKLETSIGAVSRVRAFSQETENENKPDENNPVPESWPTQGSISFKNLSATYDNTSSDLVIRNISMTIKHGQKVGICGRSGSGKSSLISCLFRLMDTFDGSILIDGIDISKIPRQELRSRLVALPQESFFWIDTVRKNLDPFGQQSDERLVGVLDKVHLLKTIEAKGGLDAIMSTELLSQGQRQLLCLARAMLRKGTILVLDEATSSVDTKTDEMMQRIIREEFKDYTIIAVAHRLNTIIDFDKVAVLEAGELVEFDAPSELLKIDSRFRDLWQAFGGDVNELA